MKARSVRKLQRHFREWEEKNGVENIFAHSGVDIERSAQSPTTICFTTRGHVIDEVAVDALELKARNVRKVHPEH